MSAHATVAAQTADQRSSLITAAVVQGEALVTMLLHNAETCDATLGVLVRLQDLLGVIGSAAEPGNEIVVDDLHRRVHGVRRRNS